MTIFMDLMAQQDKQRSLLEHINIVRSGDNEGRIYDVDPVLFKMVPGSPFAYWAGVILFTTFKSHPALQSDGREVQSGASTMDDGRFLRLWWEIDGLNVANSRQQTLVQGKWVYLSKGGAYAQYHIDLSLQINWANDGAELKEHVSNYRGHRGWGFHWAAALNGYDQYFRPGLTWPRRTQRGLSVRVLPAGVIFGDKGPSIFCPDDGADDLLALLAIANSEAFKALVSLQISFGSFEVGVLERTPVPSRIYQMRQVLSSCALRSWSLMRSLDTVEETSHAFVLPRALRTDVGDYDPLHIRAGLAQIQGEIDDIAFELYGFSEADCGSVIAPTNSCGAETDANEDAPHADSRDEEGDEPSKLVDDLATTLSWCVGVAFGRFDWRLATGEREVPSEPDPFEPLPVRSPGMLPEGSEPFHEHTGILIDDPGHPHDLARLVENVLERVNVPVAADVRRWLQREFFPYHLQRYSKSRRKAPIYWPLSTASGSYTLWLYCPALTDQTLYTAANDFVGPKLDEVNKAVQALRTRTDRSRDEERRLEQLQDYELELKELQDELLRLAPTWKPNHDDGVQITAAPLWRLFRHKPWQKVLRETWAKLEAGEYDWAHLAMSYWPERVREKCRTDKSLAIAHGLEELYEPQAPDAAKV